MRCKTYARTRRVFTGAQRDTTTEKPRVMAEGSTHQADDDAAEKNPQYLAADIQSRLRAARVRPAVKIRGSPLLIDNLYGMLCSIANCRST